MTALGDRLRAAAIVAPLLAGIAAFSHGCSPDGDPPTPALPLNNGCSADFRGNLVYALDTANVSSLVADSVGIYWASTTGVWMLPHGATDAVQLAETNDAVDLVTDGENVYWASINAATIAWTDRLNRSPHSMLLFGGGHSQSLRSFAIDARYFYIASTEPIPFDGGGSAFGDRISRIPLAHPTTAEYFFTEDPLAHGGRILSRLIAANDALYWVDGDGLKTLPDGATSASLLARFDGNPGADLVVDARGAYWTVEQQVLSSTIVGLTFSGGATSAYAIDQGFTFGLVLDPAFLYWVDEQAASLQKLDRATGAVTSVTAATTPRTHAVGGEKIYWVDDCDPPAIRAIAK